MNDPGNRPLNPIDGDTLDAISTLTIQARRVVEGLQGGNHASLHLGASVEFAEHKKYSQGDDIRWIDWRALARTDRYFVKQHQREVILRCLLLLDCSASMGYRGSRVARSKLSYAALLLAAMSHVIVRQGDEAGVQTFADGPLAFLPARRRPDHLAALMRLLAAAAPALDGKTGYTEAITRAADGAGRRALVVLASDLWGAGRETEVALARLAGRGHDVVVLHVLDPDELDFPFERPATFEGLEGEPAVDVDPSLLREDYRREVAATREHWRRVCGEAGIDFAPAFTNLPAERVLAELAARRHTVGRRR